jgi:MarR family 2-MHQ and catechol resistance regulon transcriptional repressor
LPNQTIVPEDRRESYYHDRLNDAGPSYSDFDLLSAQLALSLLYTHDVFIQAIGRYLAASGLSRAMFNILMLLRHGPEEGMQLHDLGELLLVSRANITGLINHLEEKGYVTRTVDAADRRARYARITSKAEALLTKFIPLHYRNIKTLFADLTVSEKTSLISSLKKTRLSLQAHASDLQIRACNAPQA